MYDLGMLRKMVQGRGKDAERWEPYLGLEKYL